MEFNIDINITSKYFGERCFFLRKTPFAVKKHLLLLITVKGVFLKKKLTMEFNIDINITYKYFGERQFFLRKTLTMEFNIDINITYKYFGER